MAETTGMYEIRGLQINKLVKGYSDEAIVFKKFCQISSTPNREIRWYQKTSGYLDSADTSGITASQIDDISPGAKPVSIGPSFTRQTSMCRAYKADSELITIEDERDMDPDVLAITVRDVVRGVMRRVDARIYSILSANAGNTVASQNGGWNASGGDPISDILDAKKLIREDSYEPKGINLLLSPADEKNLILYIISTKGSSIPGYSSNVITSSIVDGILQCKVTVSTNVTADEAMLVADKACKWKEFMPLRHYIIDQPGIGKIVRVVEEGEAILEEPNACC